MKSRMMERKANRITDNLILIGIGLGASYWILESAIDAFVFHEGTFLEQLFTRDANELWVRLLIIFLFISFGVYARFIITERKRAEEHIKKYSEELEERLKLLEGKGVSRYAPLIKEENSYLIKEERFERSLAVFSDLVKFGSTGLCLTVKHLDILKETYDVKDFNCECIWLSTSGEKDAIDPSNLTAIHGKVSEFTKNKENSVVLFLGLEYIITVNEFEKSLKFLNSIINAMVTNNSRLIIPIDPETLDSRELSLLEKSLIEIKDENLIRLGLK